MERLITEVLIASSIIALMLVASMSLSNTNCLVRLVENKSCEVLTKNLLYAVLNVRLDALINGLNYSKAIIVLPEAVKIIFHGNELEVRSHSTRLSYNLSLVITTAIIDANWSRAFLLRVYNSSLFITEVEGYVKLYER